MSNNSLLEILTVRFNDVIKANISEAFNATRNKQKEVITAKEWPAFIKNFYNLQVELQSGFKNLNEYLYEKKKSEIKANIPIGKGLNYLQLKYAIKDYIQKNYTSAYNSFKNLANEDLQNTVNKHYAFSVTEFLKNKNKFSDALKVYKLIYFETKVAKTKEDALLRNNKLQIKK
ncbi:34546_t:CDS:2 [Gigaspora margarita]|uniref:34546_t:CDS:1 n=1 Tax=Gigaspora margarita TaxID=4874 RepID=A0ABM8VX19_GIGMA|nr:34546_t:CDS:2 [Gigaspora margarita]